MGPRGHILVGFSTRNRAKICQNSFFVDFATGCHSINVKLLLISLELLLDARKMGTQRPYI